MSFFKNNDDDWMEDSVIDSVTIAKMVREDKGIKKEIQSIVKGETDMTNGILEKVLQRLEVAEKRIAELSETSSVRVATPNEHPNSDVFERILIKKMEYQNAINALDGEINTEFGKAYRSGKEVDNTTIHVLEEQINVLKKKIAVLEPIAEVLNEIY